MSRKALLSLLAVGACLPRAADRSELRLSAPSATVLAKTPRAERHEDRAFDVRFARAWAAEMGTTPLLARSAQGDVLLGYFGAVAELSPPSSTGSSVFVRLSGSGAVRSAFQMDETGYASALGFDEAGGDAIAGIAQSATGQSGAVWRFTSDGTASWAYVTQGRVDIGSVGVDELGRVVAAGRFRGSIDTGLGRMTSSHATNTASDFATAVVVALDASGRPRWAHAWDEVEVEVFVTSKGSVLLVGRSGPTSSGTIDLGGGPIAARRSFVASFDADGRHVWSHALEVDVVGATMTRSGRLTLLTVKTDPIRYEVAELDANGRQARRVALHASLTGARSIGVDRDGHFFVGAFLDRPLQIDGTKIDSRRDEDGPQPFVLLELDKSGQVVRSEVIRNGRCDTIAVAPDGSVAVGGWTDRPMYVGAVVVPFPAEKGHSAMFLTILGRR